LHDEHHGNALVVTRCCRKSRPKHIEKIKWVAGFCGNNETVIGNPNKVMHYLITIDRRILIVILLILPLLGDVFIGNFTGNEIVQFVWISIIFVWYLSSGSMLAKKDRKNNKKISQLFTILVLTGLAFQTLDSFFQFNLNTYLHYGFIISYGVIYFWIIYFVTTKLIKLENYLGIKSDGFMTFIWVFVLPIGIWWIQPRVQKIMTSHVPSSMDILNSES